MAPFFLVQQFSKLKIKSTKIQGKVFFVGVHLREFIIDERTDTENGQRTQIAQFLEQRIVLSESSTLTATELYLEYCHWCKARNNEPLVLPTFGRLVGEYGLPKAKVSGRIRYVGVAIAATPHDLASIPSQGLGTKFRQIEVVEGVTDTMGSARNPDRAGVAGRRLIGNLWSAIAGYAVQAPRTIALTTAGAIFHATPTGAKIIAASAPVLEIAMVSGGSIALQAQAFISQNAPLLLALAEAGGPRLEWLSHFIQSFKSARAQSLIQSQGVAGKTRPGA